MCLDQYKLLFPIFSYLTFKVIKTFTLFYFWVTVILKIIRVQIQLINTFSYSLVLESEVKQLEVRIVISLKFGLTL